MNTWQTVYEQLQEMLNKCIELWWKPKNKQSRYKDYISEIVTDMDFYEYTELAHILFSKDSGLMEFVNRKNDTYTISRNKDKKTSEYFYMVMWIMTAEEKCNYFVENARVPKKKQQLL